MVISTSLCGCMMLLLHHLRPLSTYSSPSRTMVSCILVASDDATCGSVIAYVERISPASSGRSHWSCWAALPNLASTSMLPRSGAEQLKTSNDHGIRPMTSANGANSRLVNPGLHSPYSAGKNQFQIPASFAFTLSSSITGGCFHRLAPSMTKSWCSRSRS